MRACLCATPLPSLFLTLYRHSSIQSLPAHVTNPCDTAAHNLLSQVMQTFMVLLSIHEKSFDPLCGVAGEVRPLHVYDQ
jgi:hypothetical protein